MEGDTVKDANSSAHDNAPAKKPVAFHSENIAGTKAKEKREVFVNVTEEKKTIKQSAEEFQKKFADAKAHAAETRAKITNPGADEHGVIRSRQLITIPWKKIFKFAVPILILAGIGAAVYLNWDTIYHEFFEVSESRAHELLPDNPARYISMYDQLIEQATSPEKKAELLLEKGIFLEQATGSSYSSLILQDAYTADSLLSCRETAERIVNLERTYGSESTAAEWEAKLSDREEKGIALGNG